MSDSRIPIVVSGTGGHGRETMLLVEAMIASGRSWEVLGYLTDDANLHGTTVGAAKVLGDASVLASRPGSIDVALGIGSPLGDERSYSVFATPRGRSPRWSIRPYRASIG